MERLKAAIERARAQRESLVAGDMPPPGPAPGLDVAPRSDEGVWSRLGSISIDPAVMARNRIVAGQSGESRKPPFDILRTTILKACEQHGWRRIGVSSPTVACGKTTVCVNLALCMAERETVRTVVMDVDMRRPMLAEMVGASAEHSASDFLRGRIAPEAYLQRAGDNLAFGFNVSGERDPVEAIQGAAAGAALAQLTAQTTPTVMLFDMAPMLAGDDAIGFLRHLDGVLLIAAAGKTTSAQIKECERMIGDTTSFIGVVLNKCEDESAETYGYGYPTA